MEGTSLTNALINPENDLEVGFWEVGQCSVRIVGNPDNGVTEKADCAYGWRRGIAERHDEYLRSGSSVVWTMRPTPISPVPLSAWRESG